MRARLLAFAQHSRAMKTHIGESPHKCSVNASKALPGKPSHGSTRPLYYRRLA